MKQYHNIQPVYNKDSYLLILGSFPSVKSREGQFFYHHPQNRFWKIFEQLFDLKLQTIEDKKAFLLKHHIAVWDVIASCDIVGSSDSSIETIYTNGKKAHQLYQKYIFPVTQKEDICLPSTSPANATYSLEKLIESWRLLLNHDLS